MSRRGFDIAGRAPASVAGVCRSDGVWSVVIVDGGSTPSVRAVHRVERGEPGRLSRVLRAARADVVVGVLPASAGPMRVIEAPKVGTRSDVIGALTLLAEAHYPHVPLHRRCVITLGDGRHAGLCGWTGSGSHEELDLLNTLWTPQAAALDALRHDPHAPTAVYSVGSGTLCSLSVDGARSRVVSLNADGRDREGALLDAIGADAAGVTVEEDAELSLVLDMESHRRALGLLAGHPHGPGELLACGAALRALDADALTRLAAGMTADAPLESRAGPAAVWDWMCEPRHAGVALAAAVLAVCLGPMLLAQARATFLASRVEHLDQTRSRREAISAQLETFDRLDAEGLPATKLLADVAALTPVHVRMDSIQLTRDQGLQARGQAANAGLVVDLRAALSGSGVFRDVRIDRQESGEGGVVSFSLSARLSPDPFTRTRRTPEQDFAARSLSLRLYEDGLASGTPSSWSESGGLGRASSRSSDRGRPTGALTEQRTERPPPAPVGDIPEPLTDEQIEKMDRVTTMREFASRRRAAQGGDAVPEDVRARLNGEAERLRARLDQLRGGS